MRRQPRAAVGRAVLLFIAANLAVGFTFSTLARNQLQAMQMTFFFFLPSMLLSGFMFPFRGMPQLGAGIGEVLPLTHFLRIVRGILLKGNGVGRHRAELWPIGLFMLSPAPSHSRVTARRSIDGEGRAHCRCSDSRWYNAPNNRRSSGPVDAATIRFSRRTFLRGQHCLTIRPAPRCGHCSTLKP